MEEKFGASDEDFKKYLKEQKIKLNKPISENAVLITDEQNITLTNLAKKYKEEIKAKVKIEKTALAKVCLDCGDPFPPDYDPNEELCAVCKIRKEIHKIVTPHLERKSLSLFFDKYRKYYNKNKDEGDKSDFDNIVNELYIKFREILETFDPDKGDFRKYWINSIGRWKPKRNKIILKVKGKNGKIITYEIVSLEEEAQSEADEPEENKEALLTYENTFWQSKPEVSKEELYKFLEKILPPEEFEIIKIKFENEKITFKEIAVMKGKNVRQIEYIYKKAKDKLKKSGLKVDDFLRIGKLISFVALGLLVFLFLQPKETKFIPGKFYYTSYKTKKENKFITWLKKFLPQEKTKEKTENNWQKRTEPKR